MQAVHLSVVIPAYNASGWISQSLGHLKVALDAAGASAAEVIVVDDGSTDGTADEAETFEGLNVIVIRQPNSGRFRARQTGIERASGTHVLFLDTRVFLHSTSLRFVLPYLSEDSTSLWTADVRANTEGNPIARFWRCIESVFWRRYMRKPKTTSFGLDDFDFYPKGTTALIGPRSLLLEAIQAFHPTVTDWRKVNDDTALLRYAVERQRIYISPDYSCTYNARTNLKAFLKHANHRGSVLIDGYLRRGTRLNIPIWFVLALAPIGAAIVVSNLKLALSGLIALPVLLLVGTKALSARFKDSVVLAALFWPFAIVYLAGMYWGLWLKFRSHRISNETAR